MSKQLSASPSSLGLKLSTSEYFGTPKSLRPTGITLTSSTLTPSKLSKRSSSLHSRQHTNSIKQLAPIQEFNPNSDYFKKPTIQHNCQGCRFWREKLVQKETHLNQTIKQLKEELSSLVSKNTELLGKATHPDTVKAYEHQFNRLLHEVNELRAENSQLNRLLHAGNIRFLQQENTKLRTELDSMKSQRSKTVVNSIQIKVDTMEKASHNKKQVCQNRDNKQTSPQVQVGSFCSINISRAGKEQKRSAIESDPYALGYTMTPTFKPRIDQFAKAHQIQIRRKTLQGLPVKPKDYISESHNRRNSQGEVIKSTVSNIGHVGRMSSVSEREEFETAINLMASDARI